MTSNVKRSGVEQDVWIFKVQLLGDLHTNKHDCDVCNSWIHRGIMCVGFDVFVWYTKEKRDVLFVCGGGGGSGDSSVSGGDDGCSGGGGEIENYVEIFFFFFFYFFIFLFF